MLAALMALRGAWSGAGAFLGKISSRTWLIIGCAVALAVGFLWHGHKVKATIAAAKAEQRAADQRALDQTVANYRAAAAKAKAEDDAKNIATQAAQQKINEEQANAYQTRIAAAHADVQRLQHNPARPANPGSPAKPDVPAIPTPTCGADSPSLDPVTRAFDCAIQLDELITVVERQHGVDPNAGAAH